MFVSQVRSLEQDVPIERYMYRYEEMADKIPSTDFSLRQNDVLLYVGADARLCCLPKRIKLWHNYFMPCAVTLELRIQLQTKAGSSSNEVIK